MTADDEAPEPAEPLAARRHFAAGDYVTRFADDAPIRIVIDTPFEKPGWKPRIPSSFGRAPYPGTAILFDGNYFEVIRIKWKEGTFPRFHYHLAAWMPEFPVREQVSYTPAYARSVLADRKKAAAQNRRAGLLQLSMPLLGLLPADDQRRIELTYGLSSSRMTFYSALVPMPIGIGLLILWLAAAFSGEPLTGTIAVLAPWGSYMFSESYIRMVAAMKFGLPMGSLVIVLPVELVRGIRRQFDPEYRQRAAEAAKFGRGRQDVFRNATDEVLELFGQEHDLEVTSILPKPHWSPQTGVRFHDTWYVPLDSRILREPKQVRYRFLLKKAPEELIFRTTCNFDPTEVRQFFRERRLRDLGTWVETFAPLFGLVDGDDQQRLRELYNYEPLKFTRWTTIAIGIGAFLAAGASVVNFVTGAARPIDAILLAFSIWLLLESQARWKLAANGAASGSIFGIFVKPFLWRFLE